MTCYKLGNHQLGWGHENPHSVQGRERVKVRVEHEKRYAA